MTVAAVIFDWGGTLTPFHRIDLYDLWRRAAEVFVPDGDQQEVDRTARALADAEALWWRQAVASGRSGTTADVFAVAAAETGVDVGHLLDDPTLHQHAVQAHLEAWTPHTVADPQAAPLLTALRQRGIRTGLLSNTHWPRDWHERWLARDGILELLDGRVYTSDLEHLKPHAEAFRAALTAASPAGGPSLEPAETVFVGDRPLDDISGAAAVGMRTILLANSDVPGHPVEPDATITQLAEVLDLVDSWR